jgi:hypothetical protein
VTLTFSGTNGTNVETGADGFTSLVDGVYDLVITPTKVHPDGVPGTNATTANNLTVFHRLFGDTGTPDQTGTGPINFSAVVNSLDNIDFRNAFNKPVGGGYQPYLDFDGDGNINSQDNLAFRTRFNKSMTWTV